MEHSNLITPDVTPLVQKEQTKEEAIREHAIQRQKEALETRASEPAARSGRDKNRPSLGVVFQGNQSVALQNLGVPTLLEPTDAVVRITSTAICGTDMHLYRKEIPSNAIQKGSVIGHEAVGVIDEIGSAVKKFKKGDRVVISGIIMCGSCEYCKEGKTSMCKGTNANDAEQKTMMGQVLSGVFGFSGGYDGLQAEHARVPLADFNLLKVSDEVSDEAAVTLSDILCTAWHGLMLAEVDAHTQSLAIWGAGPVGLLAVHLAKYIGVKNIISIDHHNYRLGRARWAGAETIHFGEMDVHKTLLAKFPEGVEKCLDCAGFRFPTTLTHRLQRAMKLESDSPEIIEEMVRACKKGGNIALIGEYVGKSNSFPIGALMEKGITLRGGHVWVQRYWSKLLGLLEDKVIDPTFIYSHQIDLESVVDAYKTVHARDDNSIKVALKTRFYDLAAASKRSKFAFEPARRLTTEST